MNKNTKESIADQAQDLIPRVERSARYHYDRMKFYEGIDNLVSFLSFIFGVLACLSIFVSSGDTLYIPALFAVLFVLLSAFKIVGKFAESSYLHNRLRGKFIALGKRIKESEYGGEGFEDIINAIEATIYLSKHNIIFER